jgi:DNA-binding beta-propeller fold protein YncE
MSSAEAAQAQARSVPTFTVDGAWPKIPTNMRMGDASSIAIDAQDNVWILTRPRTLPANQARLAAPPVTVWSPDGNYIRGWGGASGQGYEWPEREHGIHIDYKGNVWISGNSCPTNGLAGLKPVADDQIVKFTQDGRFLLQIGHSNQSKGNADTANLHRPADMWVSPASNELFVADGYGNHRVAVFDADSGAYKRMWGAYGNKPVDDDHCNVVAQTNFTEPGPQNFSIVHAIRIAYDGTVYVADRENRRVQMFDKDGKFLKQALRGQAIFARDVALSTDPEQQFLYVGGGQGIFILDRKTLDILGQVQGNGVLGAGHEIATDSKGNLYIAQTASGVQKLVYKGMSQVASR